MLPGVSLERAASSARAPVGERRLKIASLDLARELHSLGYNVNFTPTRCKSNIEMTPLCKVEVTLARVLGSGEVHRGGGVVDEQAGVQPCAYRLCHPNVVPVETAEPSDWCDAPECLRGAMERSIPV